LIAFLKGSGTTSFVNAEVLSTTGFNEEIGFLGGFSVMRPIRVGYRQVVVEENLFQQNYAGQRAAAINVQDIQNSQVSINQSNLFTNNTGMLSAFEQEHQLPFYEILTMRQFRVNHFPKRAHERCRRSEISAIGMNQSHCFRDLEKYAQQVSEQFAPAVLSQTLHNHFSNMKGVIFLRGVNDCSISSNEFTKNAALPVYESAQEIGLVYNGDTDAYYGVAQRASAIFIDQNCNNIQIEANSFVNNTLDFYADFIKAHNADIGSYFPSYYHSASTSALINIKQNHTTLTADPIVSFQIRSNTFKDQRSSEVLGQAAYNATSLDVQNYAALLGLDYIGSYVSLLVEGNTVSNMISTGEYSALFAIYYAKGTFIFRNNLFYNIGYYATLDETMNLPIEKLSYNDATNSNDYQRKLPFNDGVYHIYQKTGIFDFEECLGG